MQHLMVDESLAGTFIVLEGVDGAGTTTQALRLEHELQTRGYQTLRTAEPSALDTGQLARQALKADSVTHPATLALLFAADRLAHLYREILPALQQGHIVICDRYVLSSWVYQGLDLEHQWVQSINRYARIPDQTLFIDVTLEEAARRRQQRNLQAERFEDQTLQHRIHQGYKQAVQSYQGPIHVINGNNAIDTVTQDIYHAVFADLKPPKGSS